MDWNEVLFGKEEISFLLEIVFRTIVMFLVVVIALNFTGKRGVKQLSVFEMVMIISLGSAAGDPMFYKDVGILQAIVVFMVVLLAYRFIIYLISTSDKIEFLLEGKPIYIIKDGRFTHRSANELKLGSDELFTELRNQNIDHIGQIKCAILETNGTISFLYFPDNEVKPGLPIWPEEFERKQKEISTEGLYACSNCGKVELLPPAPLHKCNFCNNEEWVEPLGCPRIV